MAACAGWLSATRRGCDDVEYDPYFSRTNGLLDFGGAGVVHMVGGGAGEEAYFPFCVGNSPKPSASRASGQRLNLCESYSLQQGRRLMTATHLVVWNSSGGCEERRALSLAISDREL